MSCQLARVLDSMMHRRHSSSFPIPFEPDLTNEVSEHEGVLLVRLGRGSAMQMRIQPDRCSVLFRIVPIAKVMHVEGELPWQVASDSQLQAWIHPDSAIGQWLVAKGIDPDRIAEQFDDYALMALP